MSRKRPDRFQDLVGASPLGFKSLLGHSVQAVDTKGDYANGAESPCRRFGGRMARQVTLR